MTLEERAALLAENLGVVERILQEGRTASARSLLRSGHWRSDLDTSEFPGETAAAVEAHLRHALRALCPTADLGAARAGVRLAREVLRRVPGEVRPPARA